MDEREKQIDELAKTLYMGGAEPCGRKIPCKKCSVYSDTAGIYCACYIKAERLYDAGYRKLEECGNVARWRGAFECSVCHWDCDEADNGETEYKFCPGCGRKVIEKE